jgi:pyruvate, water dikinase
VVTHLSGRGIPADNVGEVSGRVLRVEGVDHVLALLDDDSRSYAGSIAVVADAGATFLAPIFSELAGLVCLTGSAASHLAIVSRDFGTPALFSVSFKSREPTTGDMVTIDTESGSVSGSVDD